MTILLSDPRVRAVPVVECGEPLVRLPHDLSPAGALVRAGLAERLLAADARAHRTLLAEVLGAQGLVNYPTEWWHWSLGDRYWALVTGAPHSVYGPLDLAVAA